MRRALLASVLPAVTVLAAVGPAGPAQAREPVPFEPGTYPAGHNCDFPVSVYALTNKRYQDVTTLADGTTITRQTGALVVSWTNTITGKTIVTNVSGPQTETDNPDGTGTFVGEGNNFLTFGPRSQANTGEPGIVFTSGRAVLEFAAGAGTSFSVSGTQVNGCALLAG